MPIFARKQVAELEGFGKHLERMVMHVPGNGKTVDLRPLSRRLVSWSDFFLTGYTSSTLLFKYNEKSGRKS